MAASPISGPSPAAQLALQQIRALRQAAAAAPAAPARAAAAPAPAFPVSAPKPGRPATVAKVEAPTLQQAAATPEPNRPRGSIVNILA